MDEQRSDDEQLPETPPTAGGNGHATAGADSDVTGPLPRTPSGNYTGSIYSIWLKLTVAAVVVASVAAISWVYLRTVDSDGRTPTSGATGSGIEGFQPAEGAQVPEQSRVGLDLTPGWDGTLTINGVTIPADELTRDRQEGRGGGPAGPPAVEDRLEFVPGPDKVMDRLPSGRVCVSASVHHRADPTQQRTLDWCFTVF